jgi:hypothetical protein
MSPEARAGMSAPYRGEALDRVLAGTGRPRSITVDHACLFKLLVNGTHVEVASGGNEGTSTSVLSGDPGRTAPASALIEMDAATGIRR